MNYEETPNYRLIGKRIRELREKFGMTQENLAEAIEVSVPYVSHIERGMKRPSLQILVRIAVAFEITVDTGKGCWIWVNRNFTPVFNLKPYPVVYLF